MAPSNTPRPVSYGPFHLSITLLTVALACGLGLLFVLNLPNRRVATTDQPQATFTGDPLFVVQFPRFDADPVGDSVRDLARSRQQPIPEQLPPLDRPDGFRTARNDPEFSAAERMFDAFPADGAPVPLPQPEFEPQPAPTVRRTPPRPASGHAGAMQPRTVTSSPRTAPPRTAPNRPLPRTSSRSTNSLPFPDAPGHSHAAPQNTPAADVFSSATQGAELAAELRHVREQLSQITKQLAERDTNARPRQNTTPNPSPDRPQPLIVAPPDTPAAKPPRQAPVNQQLPAAASDFDPLASNTNSTPEPASKSSLTTAPAPPPSADTPAFDPLDEPDQSPDNSPDSKQPLSDPPSPASENTPENTSETEPAPEQIPEPAAEPTPFSDPEPVPEPVPEPTPEPDFSPTPAPQNSADPEPTPEPEPEPDSGAPLPQPPEAPASPAAPPVPAASRLPAVPPVAVGQSAIFHPPQPTEPVVRGPRTFMPMISNERTAGLPPVPPPLAKTPRLASHSNDACVATELPAAVAETRSGLPPASGSQSQVRRSPLAPTVAPPVHGGTQVRGPKSVDRQPRSSLGRRVAGIGESLSEGMEDLPKPAIRTPEWLRRMFGGRRENSPQVAQSVPSQFGNRAGQGVAASSAASSTAAASAVRAAAANSTDQNPYTMFDPVPGAGGVKQAAATSGEAAGKSAIQQAGYVADASGAGNEEPRRQTLYRSLRDGHNKPGSLFDPHAWSPPEWLRDDP